MKRTACCILFALLLTPYMLRAQSSPSCALMNGMDLNPLLGADHEASTPSAEQSCIAKSKSHGRLVMLTVVEKSPAELKGDLAAFKKTMGAAEYAKNVAVAAAPDFGPEAFSVREKGEQSSAEIHALKGRQSIQVTLNWDARITAPVFQQLHELTKAVLAKI